MERDSQSHTKGETDSHPHPRVAKPEAHQATARSCSDKRAEEYAEERALQFVVSFFIGCSGARTRKGGLTGGVAGAGCGEGCLQEAQRSADGALDILERVRFVDVMCRRPLAGGAVGSGHGTRAGGGEDLWGSRGPVSVGGGGGSSSSSVRRVTCVLGGFL